MTSDQTDDLAELEARVAEVMAPPEVARRALADPSTRLPLLRAALSNLTDPSLVGQLERRITLATARLRAVWLDALVEMNGNSVIAERRELLEGLAQRQAEVGEPPVVVTGPAPLRTREHFEGLGWPAASRQPPASEKGAA